MTASATREIMWNIPASFKYAMYASFLLSLAAMAKGFYNKYLFVTEGKGSKASFLRNLIGKLSGIQFFLQGRFQEVRTLDSSTL